jgi:SAM-dependent methyltransferase
VSERSSHWPRIARSWSLVGPPLRPVAPDLALFNQAIAGWQQHGGAAPRALILGVTPEFFRELRWPPGTQLAALDGSVDMVEAVWPGPRELAHVGSWTDMPFAAGSQDIILCDGGFGLLEVQDQQRLLAGVARVLSPRGIFTVRLFAPMGRTGSLEDIAADLLQHRVASLDQLKLRLWGALQGSAATGVRPSDVVAQIHAMSDNGRILVEQLGWNREHVERLQVHRDSNAVYHLTDESGLSAMAGAIAGLRVLATARPGYPYGDACPIVTLQRA